MLWPFLTFSSQDIEDTKEFDKKDKKTNYNISFQKGKKIKLKNKRIPNTKKNAQNKKDKELRKAEMPGKIFKKKRRHLGVYG